MDRKIYVFKVALYDDEDIWRSVAVRSDQTLDHLHQAIFKAFDRYDEHLYSFYFPEKISKSRINVNDGAEYASPDFAEDPGPDDEIPLNAAKAKIGDLDLTKGREFSYLFDFSDSWWHIITVLETEGRPEKGKRYPSLLEKRGESPPQYPDEDDYDDEDYDDEDYDDEGYDDYDDDEDDYIRDDWDDEDYG